MIDDFENHCWRDVVPADVLDLYKHYKRDIFVGPRPAMLVIDLYALAYQGGPNPVSEVSKTYPSSCGINAWNAIEPTRRLFAAARAAALPFFYSTGDTRAASRPSFVKATNRRMSATPPELFEIRPELAPEKGDVIITKQRASAFFGTPLSAHLTQLGIQSLIVVGESTSGCVRASTVDGYSNGYHMTLVEECCFDRSDLSHKVNLFDLHHKYADVMKLDAVLAHLEEERPRKRA
ncbi:MAG TPA: isochorismatase family protein [Beijerinckiaceae bacterium]|jgi:nicotinamidase-related amidase|nr:isochorismatase family protein [Beijerinckiaceae bacterium]